MGLSRPFEAQLQAPNAWYWAIGFNICSVGSWVCFYLIVLCHYMLDVYTLFSIFYEAQLRDIGLLELWLLGLLKIRLYFILWDKIEILEKRGGKVWFKLMCLCVKLTRCWAWWLIFIINLTQSGVSWEESLYGDCLYSDSLRGWLRGLSSMSWLMWDDPIHCGWCHSLGRVSWAV